MSERISSIKEYFLSLPEVKRIQELEHYIDSNALIQATLHELKEKQKQLINAKEFRQINQYQVYTKEYDEIKKQLLDLPFVEEYLELLEIVDNELKTFSLELEYSINHLING